MATLSPPLSLPSRPQSLVDARARPSISRPSSPSPRAGESATTIAWRNALNSFRKSLSDKDFKCIMIPVGPEDVANEVEKWQCRQSASWHSQVAAAVRAGVGHMQRFSASIDMLAQGSPSPGCLLWGSIKFVLTVGVNFIFLHQHGLEISCTCCGPPIEDFWCLRQGFNAVNNSHGVLISLIDRASCCRGI